MKLRFNHVEDKLPATFAAVLTWHEDDLYPQCAMLCDGGTWLRILEGPEDSDPYPAGYYEPLTRAPTHWAALPLSCDVLFRAALSDAGVTGAPAKQHTGANKWQRTVQKSKL